MTEIKGLLISPTGKGIRNDRAGLGHYHAARGLRLHKGMDFLCDPGQNVICPLASAEVIRLAYPYPDQGYEGLLIRSPSLTIKIFYLIPADDILHKILSQGDLIGTAQDITKRYNDHRMLPHIHMQIESANPALFLEGYNT